MLIEIPKILTAEEVKQFREALEGAEWVDGKVTAGYQSAQAKNNMQLPEDHPVARELGGRILDALSANPLFTSAALPLKVFPPLFNRYAGGQSFGNHVDNSMRRVPSTPHFVRTDLSATLFLSGPEEYEGGELVIETTYGGQSVKLPAGHMVLYPSTSLHHVRPVTRGVRVCSFFWLQSMIRDGGRRTILFDLDLAIQNLSADHPEHPSALMLTGVYHNLIRCWADS